LGIIIIRSVTALKHEKQKAALSSILAATFLTAMKTVVGLLTGSLGIMSEALHSLLDLLATVITFFAVRFSDKPADSAHHYGHGKMESFSALIETVLLLATCVWIIYEAVEKLFFNKGAEMTGALWGALVMGVSIIVDSTRVKILKRAAKKYGSQALEADALHFSSDIWSSSVVLLGVACVGAGQYFHIPALKYADPIAALGVALLVIKISIKLGKETIDVLLDTAPKGMKEQIEKEIADIPNVIEIGAVRIRPSGAVSYIEITVGVDSLQDHTGVHGIVTEIRERVAAKIPRSDIVVSTYPIDAVGPADDRLNSKLERIVGQFPCCRNIHNVHVYELGGKKKITAHVELLENLPLNAAHELSHQIAGKIGEKIQDVDSVSIFFERAERETTIEDVTDSQPDMAAQIGRSVRGIDDSVDCHDIRLYKTGEEVSAFLHCGIRGEFTVDKL
jgi:cation diffusion facilitator family transporter